LQSSPRAQIRCELRRRELVNSAQLACFYKNMLKNLHRAVAAWRKKNKTVLEISRDFVDIEYVRQRTALVSQEDPVGEYLTQHASSIEPNRFFEYRFYRQQVKEEIRNPLFHYIEEGERKGLKPGPNFDPQHYSKRYPDVAASTIGLLQHFMKFGFWEGREPRAVDPRLLDLVDDDWIRGRLPQVIPENAKNLLNFYLFSGPLEISPCPEFDPNFYRLQIGERASVGSLVEDYLAIGEHENKRPSLHFDPYFYREAHLDASSMQSSLHHYRTSGKSQGLSTEISPPLENLLQTAKEECRNERWQEKKFADYVITGWTSEDPNKYFSLRHYLGSYPDLLRKNINPLVHYLLYGEPLGISPSPKFDPAWYYERYPDVKAANISALGHYLEHGLRERRIPVPPPILKTKAQVLHEMQVCGCSLNGTEMLLQFSMTGVSKLGHQAMLTEQITVSTLEGERYLSVNEVFLKNTIIIGGTRFLLNSNEKIAHDEAELLREKRVRHEKYQGASRRGEEMRLHVRLRPGKKIARGIHVMHEYDPNYFHFVAETLPRVARANSSNISVEIPLLVTRGLHPNLLELLRSANTLGRPVIEIEQGVTYEVEELYYFSDSSMVVDAYDGGEFSRSSYIDIGGVKAAIRPLNAVSKREGSKRIFAVRKSKYRALINQTQIAEVLEKNGFDIVDCGDLSLAEQISVFKAAEIIVSPTGAQLTNVVWCQPGCKVVVLASDHPSHQLYLWELLGRLSGAKVCNICGPSIPESGDEVDLHSNYSIDAHSILNCIAAEK